MTTETGVTAGGEAIFQTELPADAPETFNTPGEAAAYFTSLKEKKSEPAESAQPATAETELADEANTAPREEAHGEDEEADPAEQPPIERPKSWTESEDAEWRATPRTLQQKIVARELERDTALRRAQNDAAEKTKAVEAEVSKAEKARQQYEAQLPALKQAMLRAQSDAFPDIKTWDDVKNLQRTDPFRYQEWDVHQKELALVDAQDKEAAARQAHEHQTQWAQHVQKENELAAEHIPELADKVKGPALTQRVATELLPELGFKDSELNDLASGKTKLSIYDHRVQRLLADAVKLRDIQNAKTAVAAKPVPPVLRPGTPRPPGQGADSERIQALNRKPELTVKEATELYTLQQRSQRRAS